MKKVIAMLLAIVMTLSIGCVAALAEGEKSTIVIDGIKDAVYSDKKMIDSSYWGFFDRSNTVEPVDPERVKTTLWFDFDDTHIYLYFQAESKDTLRAPKEGEVNPPDRSMEFFEQINVYVDTAPSFEYLQKCTQVPDGTLDEETGEPLQCNHFCCASNNGEAKNYRIMARSTPAWNIWNNFYRSHEGMFLTYEEFLARRCVEKLDNGEKNPAYDASYIGNEEQKYLESNGNKGAKAVSFIDYETNTYGFEMSYPRYEGEEFFQFNIAIDVNEKDWEIEGPELGYGMAICKNGWLNSDELLEIYYEDYLVEDIDPAVAALTRKLEQIPSVENLDDSHINAITEVYNDYNALSDELKAQLVNGEADRIAACWAFVEKRLYIKALGDINGDNLVNANDALMALKASVKKVELDEAQLLRAEVDGKEGVNANDALEMLQFAVKKRAEFSIVKTLD